MTQPAPNYTAGRSALIDIIVRRMVRDYLAGQVAAQPAQGQNPVPSAPQPPNK